MSTGALPNRVDPRKLAHNGAEISARVDLLSLPRVLQAVNNTSGDVGVELAFRRDEQGLYVVEGELDGEVLMTCQRCMGDVSVPLHSQFNLAMVWDDDAAKQLPRYLEPLVVGSEPFDLHVLVEDEVLLCLPFTAFHNEGECSGGDYRQVQSDVDAVEEKQVRKESPFAALAKLKTND